MKQKTISKHRATELVNKAFPQVNYSENKFINVKSDKSPFDGDITYWSKRNSKFYDGNVAKALKRQNHSCGYCGLNFIEKEQVELHHIDGKHNNWNRDNLLALHRSCHQLIHMGKRRKD